MLKAAELDPDDALVQIELGDICFSEGDVAGAKACYERALELGRNMADVLALLAKYVAGILGRPEEALPGGASYDAVDQRSRSAGATRGEASECAT